MQRTTFFPMLLTAIIAAGVPMAVLAHGPGGEGRGHGKHAQHGIDRDVLRNASAEERAVLKDLRRIDAMYRREGLSSELPALYQDVLARTQNVTVTTVVNARLQRLLAPRADREETIAALRERVDANLATLK